MEREAADVKRRHRPKITWRLAADKDLRSDHLNKEDAVYYNK